LKIDVRDITNAVARLCIEANTRLRPDIYKALKRSLGRENNQRARRILQALLDNADCARSLGVAVCQDTGLAYVFVQLGQEARITGGDLLQAINKGIEQGYKNGGLRNSVIAHPLKRRSRPKSSPGIVHIDMVKGRGIKISILPKGFGSENKSQARMFNPTAGIEQIKDFIITAAGEAGADACPPFIVGVGIGGGMDQAASLAKKALLRKIDRRNPDRLAAGLEKDLLRRINKLGIGPMGLGGKTTCLAVNILTSPTHIAGLPVAVNISCHALRSATKRI
jgi:fumarate hydratase subunit alpha